MTRIKQHKYTDAEKAFLAEFVPGHSYREITDEFNRRFPEANITPSQIKSSIARYGLHTGNTGYFLKGGDPRSYKPKKGEHLSPDTEFKPGQLSHNTDPIGTEKVLDGYVWVKIDNQPKVKKNVNWIQKHRKIWQEANGPIPPGMYVIFLDGDRMNCKLENLALISRADNAILNNRRLRKEEPELTKTALLIAEVMAKMGKKGAKT